MSHRVLLRGCTALLALALVTGAAGCGRGTPTSTTMPSMAGMSDQDMPAGDGRAASESGYHYSPAVNTLSANTPSTFTFRITGPSGRVVTDFTPEQTMPLHFYLIRADLTGFEHLHPTMAADGTWHIALPALPAGDYRSYVTFTTPDATGKPLSFALSAPLAVPGTATTTPLPPASPTATVDGYTLTLSGQATAGMSAPLTLQVSQGGRPVTDLQPYLGAYAHLTAFHAGDLAFAHVHPQGTANGDHGGPALTFDADFPSAGQWRLYVQFQTDGTLHTAAFTVEVK